MLNETLVSPTITHYRCESVTLRDQFAMAAMQGMCANPYVDAEDEEIAKWAYQMADAMLAEREKSTNSSTD